MQPHVAVTSQLSALLRILAIGILWTALISFMGWMGYRLYLAEPPIPPMVDPAPAQTVPATSPRAVLVVIDGLREDVAFNPEFMPHWASLAQKGASGVAITPPMTLTTMSVVNMGTGMTPGISWSLKNFDAEPYQDESLVSLAHSAGHPVSLIGDASWDQLFGAHADHTLDFEDHGFYQGATDAHLADTDRKILEDAERRLGEQDTGLFIIHVVGTDKTAHRSGAHSKEEDGSPSEYALSAQAIDARLARLFENHGANTTWLLMADHGVTLAGNHGGAEEEARRAPFVITGPGIRPATDVTLSLNAVAPTLAALLGVRSPRVAEALPAFEILDIPGESQHRLERIHLTERARHVAAHVTAMTQDPDALDEIARLGTASEIAPALEKLNGLANVATDSPRRWIRPAGLAIGFSALLVLFLLLIPGSPRQRAGGAILGSLAMLGMLEWPEWQFPMIRFIGELFAHGAGGFIKHGAIIVAGSALVYGSWRGARKAGFENTHVWITWALGALALGQSVMKWPYGPLPEMYRNLVLGTLFTIAAVVFQRTRRWTSPWAGGALCMGMLYAVAAIIIPDGFGPRLVEDSTTQALSSGAVILAGGYLLHRMMRGATDAPLVIAALGSLLVLALVHRVLGEPPESMRLFLFLVLPVVFLVLKTPLTPDFRRDALLLLALAFHRALAPDPRVLLLVLFIVALRVLSSARLPNRPWTTPAITAMSLLLWMSFFRETGHLFSFSSIDVTVTFAATRDQIHLGESFALILLQHIGPWLALLAAALYNRTVHGDSRGVRTLPHALLGALAIQGLGAFYSFEAQQANHWFTMYAVPFVVFGLSNALVVTAAWLIGSGWSSQPPGVPEES